MKKIIGLILILVMIMVPAASFADDIDASRACTLKITSASDVKVINGMEFDIYKVAKLDKNNVYEFVNGFDAVGVEFRSDNMDKWQDYTDAIASHISKSNVDPIDYAKVNEEGYAEFPNTGSKLTAGVYIVMAKNLVVKDKDGKDKEYSVHPYIISLPQYVDGEYVYDVTSYPKTGEFKETSKHHKLPQTGLLWWPCLALLVAGMLFLVIGLLFRKREVYEKK